jgi:hypothetical protein
MKTCRICYEEEEVQNPLLTPCKCAGSSAHIHSKCLNKWIRTKHGPSDTCEVCKTSWTRDEIEPVGIPTILYYPSVLFLLWTGVLGGCFMFVEGTSKHLAYKYINVIYLVYQGVPYGLIGMTGLYGVVALQRFDALRHKSQYIRRMGLVQCRTPYMRVDHLFCVFLYLVALVSTFILPIPGCIIVLSCLSEAVKLHRTIVGQINKESVWEVHEVENVVEPDD